MSYRVGVDIGGSFTDFAVLRDDGSVHSLKVFSRPDQPGEEIREGIAQLKQRYQIEAGEIDYFTHGTTVGVNTVIQRSGLRLALFTTEGFGDVLELARLKIPNMYDLFSCRPAPLITRDRVYPIVERIDAEGEIVVPLQRSSVERAIAAAKAAGCEGFVVSLLHSYRNPTHEQAIKSIASELAADLPIYLSSEVWPIVREYERTVTSTVSGYVQPRVAHYLTSLQQSLKQAGIVGEPRITKSNGGVMTAEQSKSDCIQMVLSGTASGVIGAAFIAQSIALPKVMSFDLGGTSADVSLILDGKPQYGIGETIGDFQVFIPSVSVSSIGEGGGSIAWIDDLGVLKVGPDSAGSSPGPACYNRGGTRPTVTDSFAACGLIGSTDLGFNAVKVDVAAARAALLPLAKRLDRSIEATAEAIQNICISGMYTGVSALISRYGVDPREYTLLAFGGAGPMMAAMLARAVGMRDVLVPTRPGVLSALGGLVADLKNDFIHTFYRDLEGGIETDLQTQFTDLRQRGIDWLKHEQEYDGVPELNYSAEMRYAGQSFEVETPLSPDWIANGNLTAIADAFHQRHESLFGHCDRSAHVQVISLRLVVSGSTPKPQLPMLPESDQKPRAIGTTRAWIDGAFREVSLYRRAELKAGQRIQGPAIIPQDDCTTVVPTDCVVTVDKFGNLRIAISSK